MPGAALALAGLALVCYLPGLSGGFLFDDEANIERNARIAIVSLSYDELRAAAASGHSGPLGRPISMLSFAVGYYFHGLSAYHYKLTNILIHALNALALGALAWLLLRAPTVDVDRKTRQWICVAAAAAWLLHPFNLSGVLYVVQRMASLATLFTCCGLLCYAQGRLRQIDGRRGWPWIIFGTLAFGTLAVLSKETGALLPLFCLVVELTLFRGDAAAGRSRLLLLSFFVVTVAGPALYVVGYLASHPEWLERAFSGRDFDGIERLMTESRVVLWYLRMILLPDISGMALLLDDIPVSRSLVEPITTLPAIAAVIGLIALAFAVRRKAPLASFAILWFFCGHALESTILPLEIAYEHRNYLPSFGPVLAVFYYLLHGRRLAATIPVRRLAAVGFIGLLAVSTHARATTWSSPARLFYTDAANHPASPRNNYFAGRYLAATARPLPPPRRDQLIESARRHYEVALAAKPRMAAAQIAMICLYAEFDRPVPSLWVRRLEHILAQPKRPLASTLNAMHHLTQCAMSHPRALPRETYLFLVETLMANPTTPMRGKKLVTGFLAQYRAVMGG